MLQSIYSNLGFFGSIGLLVGIFAFLIFWTSGIAGIIHSQENQVPAWKLILSVLFPPYPLFWLFSDMYKQHRSMKEE